MNYEKEIKKFPGADYLIEKYKINVQSIVDEIMEAFIIQTLLDDDAYKGFMHLFMLQHGHAGLENEWRFKNRTTKIPLAKYLNKKDMQREFEHLRSLKLSADEESYLRSMPDFGNKPGIDSYINTLKTNTVPEVYIDLSGDQPDIRWGLGYDYIPASRLEIPTLQITLGLYYRRLLSAMSVEERINVIKTGLQNLYDDIVLLKKNPGVNIVDFSNRRRLRPWHQLLVTILCAEVPNQFKGTSMVRFGMDNNIPAVGTIAHEPHMIYEALMFDGTEKSIGESQVLLWRQWAEFYGPKKSVWLPDTYGTHNAMRWMPKDLALIYSAGRIDSANPMEAIPEMINYFSSVGVEPFSKTIIPSDGISVQDAVDFHNAFGDKGTILGASGGNLGNRLGLQLLSIIAKPYSVNATPGVPSNAKNCVKLSDNTAKPTGEPKDVQRRIDVLPEKTTYYKKPIV